MRVYDMDLDRVARHTGVSGAAQNRLDHSRPRSAILNPSYDVSSLDGGSPLMNDVTHMLARIHSGDPTASEELLPLVYDELRRLAHAKMANERPGQTLQATELVHEAYLRLVNVSEAAHWDSRGHFFAAAAEAMRRILIEHARRKQRLKHGGGLERVSLSGAPVAAPDSHEDLLALDEALTKFAAVDPIKAQLVQLRYFAGLTIPETAEILHISHATAERYWTYARTWLFTELGGGRAEGGRERP